MENPKTLCPWCGREDPHEDWCPDHNGLRQETQGVPAYMPQPKRTEK